MEDEINYPKEPKEALEESDEALLKHIEPEEDADDMEIEEE